MNDIQSHIDQWLDGNEDYFRDIFTHYYSKLLSFCQHSLKNKEEAEEIVMNVMLKAWQGRERLKAAQSFQNYLFGMLHQEMAGFFRKKITATISLNANQEIPGFVAEPSSCLTYLEIQRRYLEALEALPQRQREIFLMSREEGMGQSAIADKTGLSTATVNNHITAALKTLRQKLKQYPEFAVAIVLSTHFWD